MNTATAQQMDELLARKSELASKSAATPEFAARLRELRSWQAARLARTYRDLHEDPRYAPGVDFFLSDLYGPKDLTGRDQDLMRAWRYLKHSLPATALQALLRAVELEVLTAELDHAMVAVLPQGALDEARYARAYRAVGRRESRQHQIDLAIAAGEDLDRTVRRALIGAALRAARGPAHAAGFGALQNFLERGYDAFRRMGGAEKFLEAIRTRETALMIALFAGKTAPFAVLETLAGDGDA
jgi:hypothetical protein